MGPIDQAFGRFARLKTGHEVLLIGAWPNRASLHFAGFVRTDEQAWTYLTGDAGLLDPVSLAGVLGQLDSLSALEIEDGELPPGVDR